VSEDYLAEILRDLPLGPLGYFTSVDSTNDQALRWAEAGAPHLALVVADEQTAGRGRMGRQWFTPPGAALAFSLVLRPEFLRFDQSGSLGAQSTPISFPRLAALGTMAVCSALQVQLGLSSQIKWPNDVLLAGRKACGVLAEAHWQGDHLQSVILGIGINIARDSLPPESDLLFPATCVEAALGRSVDRWQLLVTVLEQLLGWLPRLATPEFLSFWESHLAYRGEQVRLFCDGNPPIDGQLLGLDSQGSLCLRTSEGLDLAFQAGEVHLRPLTGRPIRLN
jgi:BirA family biotin operon repressor/biotin-[acetyl-CoA-carboxylase] ligase